MDTFARSSNILTLQDSTFFIVAAALGCHLFFKRYEPKDLISIVGLLLGLPGCLSWILFPHHSNGLLALLHSLSIYLGTLAVSIVAYRLSPWHPLASYPGPVACKISKFWVAFISLKGKQHLYFQHLHDQYGDVVRIGPNEISVRDARTISDIMASDMPKGPFWDGREPDGQPAKPMIAIRNSQEHARRRRPWSRAFSTAALKGYEEIIIKRSLQLTEILASLNGTIDMTQWISYFSYDFMVDIAFGGGSEMMREGDKDGLWHLLEAGQKSGLFVGHIPWLGKFPSIAKSYDAFRAYAHQCAMRRQEKGSLYKDIFHHLIDEDGVGATPPSPYEVVADGGLAIIAGADTTSSTLSTLIWLLLCNPKAYNRLQTEIDGLGDDLMSFSHHAQLPYLNAVINECLRLYPPVLSGSQRAPEKGTGGKTIGQFYLPEGNSVSLNFYAIQRDPRNFYPEPNSFVPERWLESSLAEDVIHNKSAFLPFSQGPAGCTGKLLAYQEMRMVMCLLVHRFDMRFADNYDPPSWEEDMMDYFVTLRGKLPIVLTPRRGASTLI